MIATVLIISVTILIVAWLIDHRAPVLRTVRRRKRHLARQVPGHTEAYEPLDVVAGRRQRSGPVRSLRRAGRRLRRASPDR